RKGAKLAVDRLGFVSASENYYWWDKYGFSVRAKNLNLEEYDVTFTLFARTEGGEWTTVESKTEKVGPNPVTVYFNQTKPFQVTDANKTFSYRIKYSEYDQSGKDSIERQGEVINSKIVPYRIYDGIMVLNLFLMLAFIAMLGFFMERKLQKGVEAHESVSGRKGGNEREGSGSHQDAREEIDLAIGEEMVAVLDTAYSPVNLFAAGTALLAVTLVLAAVLHIKNIYYVHRLMTLLQKKTVARSHLYAEMTVSQGSNFTALAFASWIMLFVAAAYLYLLVPTYSPYSYMQIASLASNQMGFAILGIAAGLLAAAIILFLDKLPEDRREFRLTEIYSFYAISKSAKKLIALTLLALAASIVLSAYLGTIYPAQSDTAKLGSLLLLLLSAGILVMPIYKETLEAMR
ncbi:MAG: hypothetical protein CG440_85, partial [Methanosaeta sp. NSM2]